MGLSIFVGFFVQTVIGFAAPLIALPILTRLIGIQGAVGLVSIFLLLFSITMTQKTWRDIDRKVVVELALGGVFGVFIGVYALRYGNPIVINKLLGLFILFYVLHQFYSKKKIKGFQRFGWVFGFIAGIFSGMFSSGSPFYVSYIYNKLDKPAVIRATIIGALAVTNILRFLLLIYEKIINVHIFTLALFMLPGFVLALFLGQRMYKKLNEDIFKKVVMAFLVISSISLLV
jgi:uncharacterized membrane protein YfcA